jgi:Rad3-related DNA helicase
MFVNASLSCSLFGCSLSCFSNFRLRLISAVLLPLADVVAGALLFVATLEPFSYFKYAMLFSRL